MGESLRVEDLLRAFALQRVSCGVFGILRLLRDHAASMLQGSWAIDEG